MPQGVRHCKKFENHCHRATNGVINQRLFPQNPNTFVTGVTRYYQVSTAVFTDNSWPNHLRRMLLPGVNVALQTRESCCSHTLPQHINMIRQMKGTHLSWRGWQQAENERNEAKASRLERDVWERSERETECECDGWNWCTQTRENFRSSTFQGSPVTLYLTISLSWCQRPTDLVICKLYFEGGKEEERHQPKRKKKC